MSREGSPNKPRERLLRELEKAYPGFNPLVRIIEQAEAVREEIDLEQARHDACRRDPDVKFEDVPPPPLKADRTALAGMYEKAAKFLVPQLRAVDMSVGGLGSAGPIVVRFEKPDD